MSRIINSTKTIEKRIGTAIRELVKKEGGSKFFNFIPDLIRDIKKEINSTLFNSKTFESLLNGKLKRDFGLNSEIISTIPLVFLDLYEVKQSVKYSENSDTKFIGKFSIEISARDESDPIMQDAIKRMAYVSPRSGELINWLQWLLFEGTIEINSTWKVISKPGYGRSYLGIMITGEGQWSFEVDSEFAGVEGNNFITQAITDSMPAIEAAIKRYLT